MTQRKSAEAQRGCEARVIFDKRMTGRGPDRNRRNAGRGRMSSGGNGSSGPKSPLVLEKLVDKRGSEVADRLLMTIG
jgi:hypothetical protein